MKYLVIIEKTPNNYSAYVPDLPGCVATGATLDEAERNIHEAVGFHIDSLREHSEPVPPPSTQPAFVEVA
jgi:predicted RNase H-like HicB family nuclease